MVIRQSPRPRESTASFTLSMYNYRERQSAEKGWRPVSFDDFRRTLLRNPIARFILLPYFGIGYPLILALIQGCQVQRLPRERGRVNC